MNNTLHTFTIRKCVLNDWLMSDVKINYAPVIGTDLC